MTTAGALRAALKKLHDIGQDGWFHDTHHGDHVVSRRWVVQNGVGYVRALNEAHALLYGDDNEELDVTEPPVTGHDTVWLMEHEG